MKNSGWIILILVVIAVVVLVTTGGDDASMENETATDTPAAATGTDAEEGVMVGGSPMVETKTLVENASAADNLTTLVSAVQAAELVETLSGDGPFTVFAPTNAAFDKLPEGTVAELTQPENQERLQTLLTYHVVAGQLSAEDLAATSSVTTVAGETISVEETEDGEIMLNGEATVQTADAFASNGVAHTIDTVLTPGN